MKDNKEINEIKAEEALKDDEIDMVAGGANPESTEPSQTPHRLLISACMMISPSLA